MIRIDAAGARLATVQIALVQFPWEAFGLQTVGDAIDPALDGGAQSWLLALAEQIVAAVEMAPEGGCPISVCELDDDHDVVHETAEGCRFTIVGDLSRPQVDLLPAGAVCR